MNSENSPPNRSGDLDLEAMQTQQLEEILIDLLTVKYPGIEQADIDRFLHALDTGKLEQIEQTEADIAEKSALWQRAAQDLDGRRGEVLSPRRAQWASIWVWWAWVPLAGPLPTCS